MAASGEISWPRAGTSLAAYGEILTAADNTGVDAGALRGEVAGALLLSALPVLLGL